MSSSTGLALFRQSLVVRISERIQALCISECSGCKNDYRYAILHPCQKLSLSDRVEYFLPQVINEALEKMEILVELYQKIFTFPTTNFENEGRIFVQQLTPEQLFDRRYINEDTAYTFQYDSSWFKPIEAEMSPQDMCDELLGICQEIDAEVDGGVQVFPKIKKRKAHPMVRSVDETERIADQPKSRKKAKK